MLCTLGKSTPASLRIPRRTRRHRGCRGCRTDSASGLLSPRLLPHPARMTETSRCSCSGPPSDRAEAPRGSSITLRASLATRPGWGSSPSYTFLVPKRRGLTNRSVEYNASTDFQICWQQGSDARQVSQLLSRPTRQRILRGLFRRHRPCESVDAFAVSGDPDRDE